MAASEAGIVARLDELRAPAFVCIGFRLCGALLLDLRQAIGTLAAKPRAKSTKAAPPLQIECPAWETAGQKVLSDIADAIEILGDAGEEPNECVTPAERAVEDLCPLLLNERMLAPVFAFLEKAPVTNERADQAEKMLQDPLSILETLAAITVGSAYEDFTRKAFNLVQGAMDDLRDANLWNVNDKAATGAWRDRSVQAREDIVELLYAAYAIEIERGIDNADALYLIDMAGDTLGLFSLSEEAVKDDFTTAAHRAAALINGAKHVPGPHLTIASLTLLAQAYTLIDSLTDYLMGGVAPAAK